MVVAVIQKHAYRACEPVVAQAPATSRFVVGGIPTEASARAPRAASLPGVAPEPHGGARSFVRSPGGNFALALAGVDGLAQADCELCG
jgi:hypothetical protein